MRPEVDRFLPGARARVHALVRRWLPAARVEANVRAEVLHSLGRSGGGARVVQMEGALSGHEALVTTRRKGPAQGDRAPGVAFLSVDETSFEAGAPDTLDALRRAVATASPESAGAEIRVYLRTGAMPGPAPAWFAPYKRLFGAPLAEITGRPLPARHALVSVAPAEDLSFYAEYAAHYAAVHAERPELAPEIPVESREDMATYLAQGLLFFVIVGGRCAGVMAARRDTLAGMHGYRVLEKFLYPEFRGRGYAAAAQRCFAEALPAADGAWLFGFIHPANVWSIRAAHHDGRVEVGAYAMLAWPERAGG